MDEANRRFADWVEWTGLSQEAIAQRIGCSQVKVSLLVNGKQSAGKTIGGAIERETRKPIERDGKRLKWPQAPLLASDWPDNAKRSECAA